MRSNSVANDVRGSVQALHDAGYDILLYKGSIDYEGFDRVVHGAPESKRDKVLLVLVTLGGDIDAAYRIARYLRETYQENVTVLVPGLCKSAGTLICVGAYELVIGESGELGPLDVQVREKGELFSFRSGLAMRQALDSLPVAMLDMLRLILVDISQGGGLGTERAAEIAIRTTVGAFEPIYGQIDPERLGEVARLLMVAVDYAEGLQGNLQEGALGRLVLGYPSHSYAIDRSEAETLFRVVRKPSEAEKAVARHLGVDVISAALRAPELVVRYIEAGSERGSLEGDQRVEQQAGQAAAQDEPERGGRRGPARTVGANEEDSSGVVRSHSNA